MTTVEIGGPEGYPPKALCRQCGRDFSGDTMFDNHRVGSHDYSYSEGLKGPWVWDSKLGRKVQHEPTENGRRCLYPEEMRARGWRPMTDEEMLAGRNGRRVGFGVELWFDPAAVERLRTAFGGPQR